MRTGGQMAEDELLGHAAAERDHDRVDDVFLLVDVPLFDRELLGDAERHAGRKDRHLVHRIGVVEHVREHRMAGLVVGDDLFLFGRDCHRVPA